LISGSNLKTENNRVVGSTVFRSDHIAWPGAANRAPRRAYYITKLPKAEHDAEEWQAAMQALMLVVEHDGPTMFARIGVMKALNRGYVREFDPSHKDTHKNKHWGRRKLARDR
jgi:hypothetical protein